MAIQETSYESKLNFSWRDRLTGDWVVNLTEFKLEDEKQKDLINHIIAEIGELSVSTMTVQVPFSELLGVEDVTSLNLWQNLETTKDSIEVNLGPQNVEQMQQLILGKGTSHHGIIVGKTGSGKTNLMDVIISALAIKYSPEEIQFYLIDLKKGVGFKPYADVKLPHARVIAIDSEREFALSVLRGLITEMDERGDKFRERSVDSISSYRNPPENTPEIKLPRILLVIDEFQNLFLEDDQMAQEAAQILERLTREGRSFGVHILLGSQSLSGRASKLSSATLGQIGIRIALMCNEADARAIMADDNPEARLLSRPGEAIYNNLNGLIEGNKRFQVAYFADDVRQKYLGIIASKVKTIDNPHVPVVFEGNQLARFEDCKALRQLLSDKHLSAGAKHRAWLGEPIKLSDEPTSVHFRRQAGNNLLIVSKEESEAVGMMVSAWLSLAFQKKPDEAEFLFLNFTNVEEPWHQIINDLGQSLPHAVEKIERKSLVEVFLSLTDSISVRLEEPASNQKTKYILIFGLQRAKDLRAEKVSGYSSRNDEPSAAKAFAQILHEGSEAGIHILTCCDMATNVRRTFGLDHSKSIDEFNSRVASQMSESDSRIVLDNIAASRIDRPHRAIFYDEDRPGYLEKFRPYAVSQDKIWWQTIRRELIAFHAGI